jgi:hypothetical protein
MRVGVARICAARVLRPLTGVIVAYAVAVQGLLIALGGFVPVAQAPDGVPSFELCLHDSQDAPATVPDTSRCTHCIFCFAGAHDAAIGAAPGVFHRIDIGTVETSWLPEIRSQPSIPAYSIASPRGPPQVV